VFAELERALGTPAPQQFFTALRSSSTLSYLFPEIDQLFGVPQRAEYHPEIDCGVHTMMVLDQVCRLSDDTATRFAAVCHDLGKATTPADLLPRHHGHEERGASPLSFVGVCARRNNSANSQNSPPAITHTATTLLNCAPAVC
jgi:tRNA nucleotidyltransferase (CCA-adding enzyme)